MSLYRKFRKDCLICLSILLTPFPTRSGRNLVQAERPSALVGGKRKIVHLDILGLVIKGLEGLGIVIARYVPLFTPSLFCSVPQQPTDYFAF